MIDSKFVIRRMQPGDEEKFFQFFGPQIKTVTAAQHYDWLYKRNPHGHAYTWLVFDVRTDQLIGCSSLFPKKMWMEGNISLGSVGGDTFVDSAYRRQGIATQLHRIKKQQMRELGIDTHFGITNIANLRANEKAGPQIVSNFHTICLFLRGNFLLEQARFPSKAIRFLTPTMNRLVSKYVNFRIRKNKSKGKLKLISHFDRSFDSLVLEIMAQFSVCVVRDTDYLNWRYFENPAKAHTLLAYEQGNELTGFAALQFSGECCILFDFMVKGSRDRVKSFIAQLTEFSQTRSSAVLIALMNPKGPYFKDFIHFGFIPILRRKPFHIIGGRDEIMDEVGHLKKWYVTYSDLDYEYVGPEPPITCSYRD
jgi:GNAT superfamily N-acetyltransferase